MTDGKLKGLAGSCSVITEMKQQAVTVWPLWSDSLPFLL